MDSGPWDTISFTFQGGIIALLDVNKAATLRVHGHHRGRDAHLQIMAQSHWRLLGRPLHFARIIAYQETKTSLDMHEMKKVKGGQIVSFKYGLDFEKYTINIFFYG